MSSKDWKDEQWSRLSKRIDPETVAKIRKLREQQLTYAAIAAAVGVCESTAYKYSRDLPDPNRKITESRAAEIKHLRRKGLTHQQIGDALGITRQCAAHHSRDVRRGSQLDPVRERCRELRSQGLTLAAIAADTGLTTHQVQRRCAGIDPPSRRSDLSDQVQQLYRDGLEPEEIAERLNCPMHRVRNYMPKRDGASAETLRMRELRRQGWTYAAIAAELGTTKGRVEWRCCGVR